MYEITNWFWQKDWLRAAGDLAEVYNCSITDTFESGLLRRTICFTVLGDSTDLWKFHKTFIHWLRVAEVQVDIDL